MHRNSRKEMMILVTICCNNLEAEMKRNGISRADIAQTLNVSYSTIHSRFNNNSEWLYSECVVIRDTYFPDCTLDYLFATEGGE